MVYEATSDVVLEEFKIFYLSHHGHGPSQKKTDHCAGHWIKTVLRHAGIPFQGTEAQIIHGKIFSQVFNFKGSLPSESAGDRSSSEVMETPYGAHGSVSSEHYFQILTQTDLGWMPYFQELLPHLHLEMTIQVVTAALGYVSRADQCPLSHVQLCLCAVNTCLGLLLDFVAMEGVSSQDTEPDGTKGQETPGKSGTDQEILDGNETQADTTTDRTVTSAIGEFQKLSVCYGTYVSLVLSALTCPSTLAKVLEDLSTFQSVCEAFLLTCVLWDPQLSPSDVLNVLGESLIKRKRQVDDLCQRGAKEKKSKQMRKDAESKEVEQCQMTEILLQNTSPQQRTDGPLQSTNPQDIPKMSARCPNAVEAVISALRSSISPSQFLDIATFFSRGPMTESSWFYDPLTSVLLTGQLCVGGHVLDSDKIFPSVMTRLVSVAKDMAQHNESGQTSLSSLENGQRPVQSIPEELANFHRLKMTDGEKLLEEGRKLDTLKDLEIVKTAVEKRERGWYDLLCLGLKTRCVHAWWAQGFFDLVWENEAVLCTQTNVAHVLEVLITAVTTGDDHWLRQIYKLFSVMFRRLPAELQEQVVVRMYMAESSRRDVMAHLLSREQVASELTPLINQLTEATVPLTELLWLCLFSVDTVLYHLVQAAVDNKGQITPVVQVLRRCPGVCSLAVSVGSRGATRLCHAFCEVRWPLTEKQGKNWVAFLTFLTEPFKLSGQTSTSRGVLEVSELVEAILEPNLNLVCNGVDEDSGLSESTILHLVVSLLEAGMESNDFLKLQPISLCILLADLYVSHLDLWVDGEVDKAKVKIRQGTLKCLLVLTRAVARQRDLFSDAEFAWLVHIASSSGWYHVALVWPALPPHWATQVTEAMNSLVLTALSGPVHGSVVSLLVHLSGLNEVTKSSICKALEKTKVVVGQDLVSLLLRQILKTSLPIEIALSTHCVTALVNSSGYTTALGLDGSSTLDTSSALDTAEIEQTRQISCLFKDAVLGFFKWEMEHSSLTHVLSNYQAGLQAVLSHQGRGVDVLGSVLCDVLETLSQICVPELAEMLQVMALDVLGQLQGALKEQNRLRKHQRKKMTQLQQRADETIERRDEGREKADEGRETAHDGRETGHEGRETGHKGRETAHEGKEGERKETSSAQVFNLGTSRAEDGRENEEVVRGERNEQINEMKQTVAEGEAAVEEIKVKTSTGKGQEESLIRKLKSYLGCVADNGVRIVLEKKLQEFVIG